MSKESNSNQGLQRLLVFVFIGAFLYITGITNVLGAFWRTINNTDASGVDNPEQFLFGYGYGDEGWGDGYGYGYGYGQYSEGYYSDPACGTANGQIFKTTATSWGSYTLCTTGYSVPNNPSFPSKGDTTSWQCHSGNSYVSCKAKRSSGSSGGGGGGSYTSDKDWCPNGDYTSSRYDRKCGSAPDEGDTGDNGEGGTTDTNSPKYPQGECVFSDYDGTVKMLGIPLKYKEDVAYHTQRCTIRGYNINGRRYLMPYNDILLVELAKIIARLNPEWFDDIDNFKEADYEPWYNKYEEILDENGLLDNVQTTNIERKLSYYDFMVILLNRLELTGNLDEAKADAIIANIPADWKFKYIQRAKMLRILAFVDSNIE